MDQNNNQWVYYNGELYHSGRKGMQWGKHLPGTDWWKETTGKIKSGAVNAFNNAKADVSKTYRQAKTGISNTYNSARTNASNAYRNVKANAANTYNSAKTGAKNAYNSAKSGVKNAYTSARKGTSRLWNQAKGYSVEKIAQLKKSAKEAYKNVRKQVQNVLNKYYVSTLTRNARKGTVTGKSDVNYLAPYISGELGDAINAYASASANGPIGNQMNGFIQTAKYDVASGCARFLDAIGMDDEVASFLKKLNINPKN